MNMNNAEDSDTDVLGLKQLDLSNNLLFEPSRPFPAVQPAAAAFNFHVPNNKFSSVVFTSQPPEPQIVSATTPSYFAFDPAMSSYESLLASSLFGKAEDKSPLDGNGNGNSGKIGDFYESAMGFDLLSSYTAATRLADAAQVDPDYHQFLHAALFNGDDEDEGVPELEPDVPENDIPEDHMVDFETLAKETIAQQLHPTTNKKLPPSSFSRTSASASPASTATTTPGFEYLPPLPTPTPALSTATTTSTGRVRKATGFRGTATALIPVDAPIQPRSYATESTTSRKRKTVAIERKLAKRLHTPAPEIKDEEIPEDLLEAAERKRLQNTLSARKSRLRKQERLGELEEENRILRVEKSKMADRIEELENMLRGLGVKP